MDPVVELRHRHLVVHPHAEQHAENEEVDQHDEEIIITEKTTPNQITTKQTIEQQWLHTRHAENERLSV